MTSFDVVGGIVVGLKIPGPLLLQDLLENLHVLHDAVSGKLFCDNLHCVCEES